MWKWLPTLVLTWPWLAGGSLPAAAAGEAAEALDHFERQVRPLLAQHCWACHGPEKQEAGLRLDSPQAIRRGSDQGPIVVEGQPEQSRLIAAVRYQGEVQMPPDGPLAEDQQAVLVAWVSQGLPWPNAAPAAGLPPQFDDDYFARTRAEHWSLRPIRRPELPAVERGDWAVRPWDQFILTRLETEGLSPSPAADARVWLRRVTYDLTGLPPTAADYASLGDAPTLAERAAVVDRLLASEAYGVRWARHWLDVARYADTRGYVFTQDQRYPYSYTYRDYVVGALNRDLPYDQFLIEQIAADQLPPETDRAPLAALGFLTLGRRFMNNPHDIIDDRIDVVTRGLLGLTVACARCHDHKYDPLTMADYYGLYGVFASSVEPDDLPVIAPPDEMAAYQSYERELAARRGALSAWAARSRPALVDDLRAHVGDYLRLAAQPPPPPGPDDPMLVYRAGEIRPPVVERWRKYLAEVPLDHPVFGLWRALAAVPSAEFATQAPSIIASYTGATDQAPATRLNSRLARTLTEDAPPASLADVAERYGRLLEDVYAQWSAHWRAALARAAAGRRVTPPAALPDPVDEELRQALFAAGTPCDVPDELVPEILERVASGEYRKLKLAIGEWEATSPQAPARAMALVDAPTPVEPHIFLRGSPHRPGRQVPRQFLRVLRGPGDQPFQTGSGRLELARAIAHADNPLTARVIVNRVWLHHFGRGLVATPSDFGARGEPPTHPELLDFLAAEFLAHGWSLKWLHRELVLSATYAQASLTRADGEAVDPENRWLWRMNRRRLEFEAFRDSLLAVSGQLDPSLGGRSVRLFEAPFPKRRSLYAWIDRQDLPGTFRVFDFASPDTSVPQRPQTTVPQQALFAMNSPLVIEQARHLAARPEVQEAGEPASRVAALYQAAFGREPTAEETALGCDYVAQAPTSDVAQPPTGDAQTPAGDGAAPPGLSPWERYAQALLLTNEFMFVD